MSTWVGAAGERPLKPGSTGLYSSDPFLQEDRESSTCMLSDTAHGHVWVPGIKSGCVCVWGESLWPVFPTGLLSLCSRAEPECQHSG